MPHPRYTSEEITRRGQTLYDAQVRDGLDASHKGQFLVLDIEILRVGYPTAYRLCGRRVSFCEVCSFDFEKKYGQRGKDYIEAHHKTPISKLEGPITVTIDDLSMVCSNCHRMLHRPPWITVEELREIIENQKSE